jgi:hypothetical protein
MPQKAAIQSGRVNDHGFVPSDERNAVMVRSLPAIGTMLHPCRLSPLS